jgi:peptide/nickel transport system substrate-binding protein
MTRKSLFFCAAMVLLIGAFPDFGHGAQAKDEVLKIVAAQEPLTLDISQFGSGNDRVIIENWGEFLLSRETSGKVVPGLATTWKISADGKRMDFTLRKGVKFHSGDLFTAKDVMFSWERARKKSRDVTSGLMLVEKFEIVNDYQVTVYFKEPDVLFIPNLAWCPVVSKSYFDKVGEDTFVKQPSGTGPYKVVSYRSGEYVDLERFEEYWGKKPPVKRARINFVGEDSTRTAKLKAGEVDFVHALPFTEVKEFEKSPNFKVVKFASGHPTRSILFGANNPKVPWHDKRVRLAMAHAINYEAIINICFGVPTHWAALGPNELGYDPTLKPYDYDPKKAKALLAEAGYPNGFDMSLYWGVGGRVPMQEEIVQALGAFFEVVGIRTKLVGEETAAALARRNNALKTDAEYVGFYTASFAGGVDPVQPLNGYFSSEGGRPVYSTPEITKLILEARSTLNNAKRAELIKKIVRLVYDQVGIIPIINNVSVYGMKKNINFIPTKGVNFDYVLVKDMIVK